MEFEGAWRILEILKARGVKKWKSSVVWYEYFPE